MIDGTFTYYALQFRPRAKTDYLDPDGPLKPLEEEPDWFDGCCDAFPEIDPWKIDQKGYSGPQFQFASADKYLVWARLGVTGWFERKHATAALKRCRKAYTDCRLYNSGGQWRPTSASTYDIRLIEVTVSKETKILQEPAEFWLGMASARRKLAKKKPKQVRKAKSKQPRPR